MKKKNEKKPDAERSGAGFSPPIPPSASLARLKTELDPVVPDRRVKGVVVYTADEIAVSLGGEQTLRMPLSDLSEVRVETGVGSVFLEYTDRAGESGLLARSDGRSQREAVRFARAVNRRLRQIAEGAEPDPGEKKKDGEGRKKQSKKRVLLRLLAMSRPEWGFLFVTALFFLVATGISVLLPYLNRRLVDDYIRNDEGRAFLAGFIGTVFTILAVHALRVVVRIARGGFLTIAGNRMIVRLRDTVFRKTQTLSISKVSANNTGELMQRVNGDTARIRNFLINQLPALLEQMLVLAIISVVLFVYDWRLALLILVPAPFVALAFRTFWRFMHGLFRRRRELNAQGSAVLHDIFSGIRVVKAYGMERREEDRFVGMAAAERDAELRQEKIWAVIMPLLNFIMGVGEYVLLYYVGRQMLAGEMTAGEMSQFSSYASMIYGPLAMLLRLPRQIMMMMTSLTRVYELLDEPDEITDSRTPAVPEWKGEITVEHVRFGYEGGDDVLHDVDLKIGAGEFIGLVGKSGVGKSTLINLILRMYDVNDGRICIDGVDIREIPQVELRSHMGVVLQENFLFTGSVRQNIAYAKPGASNEEIIRAAKMAGAHDFIVRLPDGYNTYVGEKGYTLSGGERQRISIARALLHDPRVLILDEATASLDTETEKLIQDALQTLCKGRTTIAIAHRLSTLRNATRLVVLDRGKVAETGTHEELMERKGIYYGLVMAQREMAKFGEKST